jgi:hypothetical protein
MSRSGNSLEHLKTEGFGEAFNKKSYHYRSPNFNIKEHASLETSGGTHQDAF